MPPPRSISSGIHIPPSITGSSHSIATTRGRSPRADLSVEITAGTGGSHPSACQRRKATHRLGKVALVRDPDEIGLGAHRADNLGGGWEQRGDAVTHPSG